MVTFALNNYKENPLGTGNVCRWRYRNSSGNNH